jgi:senataxin
MPVKMAALRAGLDGTPLVLIQGPPGTGKTRTILNLLSVVMHSAAKGSLELVPKAAGSSGHMQPRAAAGAAAGAGTSAEAAAAAERHRVWRLQSPWMVGEPTARDLVGPSKDTGGWRGNRRWRENR